MSNQRFAGPIRHGTNLTPAESADIDQLISIAEPRREAVLREIDAHVLTHCWCGARVLNVHHCEDGHMQPRGIAPVLV